MVNTCAYDSLFQIFLAAVSDSKAVQQYVTANSDQNDMFEMIEYTMAVRKITSKTYLMRAKAIVNSLNINLASGAVQQIDAACNIAHLYEKLFKNQPTLVKQSQCCNRIATKCIPFVSDDVIFERNLELLQFSTIIETGRTCPGCNKWKNISWKTLQTGIKHF